MTYPKARITRSRSRSRNMRKKHLVKSKSKRNNRSRKTKKNHSRKYRGGWSVSEIEEIIKEGKAKTLEKGTEFEKAPASVACQPTKTVREFKNSNAEQVLMVIGYSGGYRRHSLYRSPTHGEFLIEESMVPREEPIKVYHLEDWMLQQIYEAELEEIALIAAGEDEEY